jgi:SAM-dependent methyltransferase
VTSHQKIDTRQYWTSLVIGANPSNVDEVGHPDMGRAFNLAAYGLRLRALQQALQKAGCLPPHFGVFEAGFGVGFYLQFWHQIGCARVVGVELSARAWRNAQSRFPNFDLRMADIATLTQAGDWLRLQSSFGLVTAIDILYHVVDDITAQCALRNLANLVVPGGVLIFTDKFPCGSATVQESSIVRRRPFRWYTAVLTPEGFECEAMIPVFWCMDPPIFNSNRRILALLGYAGWASMRAVLKYWPRNGIVQSRLGRIVGGAGAAIDRMVVPRLGQAPNLTMAVFRKSRAS